MANRLVGNTWIIDATGSLSTQPETKRSSLKIIGVGFYSIDSTATINIAMASNTTNILFPLATTATAKNFQLFNCGGDYISSDELNAITVTAGTAYLYLG